MSPNESEPEKGEMNCLIVDDDRLFAEVVAEAIGAKAVRIAGTMREAIDFIDRRPPNYIVLDLSLPDSKLEQTMALIRSIKDRAKGATVVVITGDSRPSTRISALEHGADMFIQKDAGDYFYKQLAAKLSAGRAGPCASRETVEKIEECVATMTGTALPAPQGPQIKILQTMRVLARGTPWRTT